MTRFTTLKGIKVDTRVTFILHPADGKVGLPVFLKSVAAFVEKWGKYMEEWVVKPGFDDDDDPIIRFTAILNDVPISRCGAEVSKFMRSAENWERDEDVDEWRFTENLDLSALLADFYYDEFAEWCGFANAKEVSYADTGFEGDCSLPYVSAMAGSERQIA